MNSLDLTFDKLSTHLQIPHFLFLRKCVAIREQLRLMGYPNEKVVIRNIPVGSRNYYLCFPELCHAFQYQVEKNEAGEIIKVISLSTLRTGEEVANYKEMQQEGDDPGFIAEIYPVVMPSSIELHVYEDEKITFLPTERYLANIVYGEAAISELENNSKQIFVTKDQISEWLKKHHDFYWSLQEDWNVAAYQSFQNLYCSFQDLAFDFQHMAMAQQTVDEYLPFDEDWLMKYDRLYFCALQGWGFDFEVFHEDPYILEKDEGPLYLVGEEFKWLFLFAKLFNMEKNRNAY